MGRAKGKVSAAQTQQRSHPRDRVVTGALATTEQMPLPSLQLQQSQRSLGEVASWLTPDADFSIELNPPYQRGAVWDEPQKVALIKSIILKLPVGAIFLNNRKPDYSMPRFCVDGQQRLRAIHEFVTSSFSIPTEWIDDREREDKAYVAVPEDFVGERIFYKDMTKVGQRLFDINGVITIYETELQTEQQEAELFMLINFGGEAVDDVTRERAAAIADGV